MSSFNIINANDKFFTVITRVIHKVLILLSCVTLLPFYPIPQYSVSKNVTSTIRTNITNIIPTNVTSTVSINSDDKKAKYKMECYILHTFLLVIILLFIITIICYHYTNHRSK